MVAVVAVAYGTQSPSLGVAEFSPTAKQQLDAPPTTAGENSSGGAGQGRRSTTTQPPAATSSATDPGSDSAPPTTTVGRARSCYGNPPRQLEDPMSPACMPTIWEGDNGGATANGVTSTEIRIAIPGVTPANGAPSTRERAIQGLFDYFNRSFELYGRRLVPVFVGGSAISPTESRALAADVASKGVFGALMSSMDTNFSVPPQAAFANELARQKVLAVTQNKVAWWSDQQIFDALHPYVWSVMPSSESLQRQLAATACSMAKSGTVNLTSDANLRGKSRKFAILATGRDATPNVRVVSQALTECTGATPLSATWTDGGGDPYPMLRTILTRFKDEGITSLVCICHNNTSLVTEGPNMGFAPEWVYAGTNYWGGEEYLIQQIGQSKPLTNLVRVESATKLLPIQARWWFKIMLAAIPDIMADGSKWRSGVFDTAEYLYPQLLMLASGIQSAGPALSAETFAAGLMSTSFPNSEANVAPSHLPSVGFGPGDHSFFDDFTVAWWSTAAPAVDQPVSRWATGSWCFAGLGTRFRPETVPATLDQMLYNPANGCR